MGNLKLDTEYGSSAASDTTFAEGTEADYYDMKRMGRKQVIIVGIPFAITYSKLIPHSDDMVSLV
jgi:hypothetical protein